VPVFESCGCARYITRDSGICSSLRVLRLEMLPCATFGQEISLTRRTLQRLDRLVFLSHCLRPLGGPTIKIPGSILCFGSMMMLLFVPHQEDAFLRGVFSPLLFASLAR